MIITETSTLLVESANSSIKDVCATRLCYTRRFNRLALEQSHEHILNVLHRSLSVPQSNAIALIPASSISSVISSAWSVHHLLQSGLAINTRSSVDIFLDVHPRILLALSRSIPNRAKFLVLNLISLQLISSDHPL